MKCETRDLVIIGGGPAGLSAAVAARESGCQDILLIERDKYLGGILNQCIHDGFGVHTFREALSGPEYADRFIQKVVKYEIQVMTNTMVISLSKDKVLKLSQKGEIKEIQAKAIVLAMGCRERTCGALSIPGHRPAGVYTAGAIQNLVNIENIMPGRNIVILGSGDIGLIMARRLTLEGARVEGVYEVLPYPSGLQRNIRQCLDDYKIPLYLSTTVVDIHGPNGRLEGVTVANVDNKRKLIANTERYVPCDTLLLSVGLIPENELTREAGIVINNITQGAFVDDKYMTEIPGIFACGNVLHVHDLVDYVSMEAAKAGANAAKYVKEKNNMRQKEILVEPGNGVRYVIPQKISLGKDILLAFRVTEPTCDSTIQILSDDELLMEERRARCHPAEMVWVKVGDLNPLAVRRLKVRLK